MTNRAAHSGSAFVDEDRLLGRILKIFPFVVIKPLRHRPNCSQFTIIRRWNLPVLNIPSCIGIEFRLQYLSLESNLLSIGAVQVTILSTARDPRLFVKMAPDHHGPKLPAKQLAILGKHNNICYVFTHPLFLRNAPRHIGRPQKQPNMSIVEWSSHRHGCSGVGPLFSC